MALNKQTIALSFSKGVDTKTDSKQVVAGKLLNLENAVLKKVGKFTKRYGYGVIANGSGISNGNALATFKNELVAYDGSSVYSYSSSDDKLYNKGVKVALDIATQSVVRNSYEQQNPDSAYHSNNISVYAWEDSSGGVRYSIFDIQTKQTIVSNALVNATGSKPKVKAIGDYILVLFLDGTDLKSFAIDANNPSAAPTTTTLASGANGYYDASYFNSQVYIAYSTGTTISIFTLSSALVQSATLTVSAVSSCLGIFPDQSNNVWIIYNDTNTVKYFIYNSSLTTPVLGITTIEVGTAPFVNVTGYATTGNAFVFYEVTGDIPSNQVVRYADVSSSGLVSFTEDFMRSVGLYSKPFVNFNDELLVTITHQSDLQPTYFLANIDKNIVCKLAPALGGGLSTNGLLAEVNQINPDTFLMAYEFKDFVQSVNGDVTTQTGINSVNITFSQPILNQEIGNQLHSSGGIISAYDSQNVNELGFNLYPEQIDVTYEKNGGTLVQGTYGYAVTYEWTDSQGQIHRSAPYYKSLEIKNDNDYFLVRRVASPGTPLYGFYFIDSAPSSGAIEDSLQHIYVGKKVSVPNYSDGYATYIFDQRLDLNAPPTQQITVCMTGYTTTANSTAPVTATGLPEYGYRSTTTIGSETVNLLETNFLSYLGSVTTGSSTIYIKNTKGLLPGMRLISSNSAFAITSNRITSVNSDSVVLNINAANTVENAIFHFVHPIYPPSGGAITSFTYDANTYGPMNYFIGQSVGRYSTSSVLNPTFFERTISNIVDSGGGIYTITLSASINTTNYLWSVGLYPSNDLFVKESATASANLENPLTITAVNNAVNQRNTDEVVVDKQASATGSANFVISSFAAPSISIDTLRVTDKTNAVINVYRTIKNGTVYYQAADIGGIENDKTVDSISFVDQIPDEVIIGNQQLYTTGGEVENIAPPAGNVIGAYKNRLIVVPNEDPLSFWYSKQVRANTPIEFNDSFVQRVPEKGGAITALQQMDDKLIIFKQDYVFVMVGDGPSVSGVNNDFTDPQIITADAGCSDKKSVVILPTGVIYKSQKGFYLLDRALNVKYIGADIEAYNQYDVTSAKMIETENQVRFTISNGTCLVYDYYVEQWAVFKNIDAADAVNFQDKYTYIVAGGEIRKENSSFTDDTAFVPMKLETGWLNLAGIMNYQRIYHIMLVGTYKSPHTLQIDLYRDFIDTPYETVTIPVLTAPTKYQYRIFPSIQKCESIKIKITELQDAPYGEGFDISAINIEVGVKRGQNKLSPDESYG